MKTERPRIDSKKLDAYLEGAPSPSKASTDTTADKKEKSSDLAYTAKTRKTVARTKVDKPPAKGQKLIGKFMVEMSSDLRKRIKFRSVADGISMNDLIVTVLQQHFR